ncbi:MAG: hypothetical protein PUC77_00945 [Bacteroidales bacterium]|nr:hypothetical protein [Bacteroidales bacterium]
MMRLILILILLLPIAARGDERVTTVRKGLVTRSDIDRLERVVSSDSIAYADRISLSGYDKTLYDRNETFYVSNGTPFRISRIVVKMVYTNLSGEMLHEQTYDIECDIPAGETRQLSVRSFDTQHTHYYYKSRKPRRSAIPYKVEYSLERYDVVVQLR